MNESENIATKTLGRVTFESSPERLKVVLPDKINWVALGLFSLAIATWLAMLVVVAVLMLGGQRGGLVRTVLILIWAGVWLWFGRFLWSRWQYYAANREVLFVDREQLILRRPVSILGLTTVYDFKHISPFYFSERHTCPAFDYAYLHVYFGRSLGETEARQVVDELNRRFFPDVLDVD